MEELISFMSYANELDDQEYIQFISECMASQSNGKQLFNKFLFNHFKNCPQSVAPFTNIAINIIITRQSQSQQQISSLDALPMAIINQCASYLCERNYFQFSKVNRKIYLGCYSPSKLYKLPWYLFTKHPPSLSMRRFKFVQKLGIDIPCFINNLSTLNQTMWQKPNHLNTLELHNFSTSKRKKLEDYILDFINKKYIEPSNITRLILGSISDTLGTNTLFKLLFYFNNINYLEIADDIYLKNDDDNISDDEIRNSLPNLTSINSLFDDKITRLIIHALGDQLESLSIFDADRDRSLGPIISSNKFPKLQELEIRLYYVHDSHVILDSFKDINSLKKATAEMWHEEDCLMDFQPLAQQFIHQTIINSLSLQYLVITVQDVSLQTVMNETERALFQCKDMRESKYLHIEYKIYHVYRYGIMDEMDLQTVRLISLLETKFDHFKIKVLISFHEIIAISESIIGSIQRLLDELEIMKQKYMIHIDKFDIQKNSKTKVEFTISTKQ